jgi:hypothetical protein
MAREALREPARDVPAEVDRRTTRSHSRKAACAPAPTRRWRCCARPPPHGAVRRGGGVERRRLGMASRQAGNRGRRAERWSP